MKFKKLDTKLFSVNDEDKVRSLIHELCDNWDYGVLVGNEKINDPDPNEFNYEKDYRTIPIDKLKKYKIGLCWDFVNYEHYVLNKWNIPHRCYMLVSDKGGITTHTFVVVEVNNKCLWIESAFWKYRGLHEITDIEDVPKIIGYDKYDIYEYNPDGLDKGLTDKEFIKRVTKNKLVNKLEYKLL